MGEFAEQMRTNDHAKNNRRRKKRKENEFTLLALEIAGLMTSDVAKHLSGKHDQSTHGNRIGAGYGYSHRNSRNITAAVARTLSQEGFVFDDSDPFGRRGDNRENRLAARSALRGVRDSRGSREVFYSGHTPRNEERNHQVGEEITIPLMSVSGSEFEAELYSGVKERHEGQRRSVVYKFPEGTKYRGYLKNEDRDEDSPHRWNEALVSGRFEVTEVETKEEGGEYFDYAKQEYVKFPTTIYRLRQTHVFDPDSGEWLEVGVEKREFSAERREELAEEGEAMAGGRYPIENAEDLKNAIRAIGRTPEGRRSAVRMHIVRRAKDLGLQELIPGDWYISKRRLLVIDYDEKMEIAKRVFNEAMHPRVPRGNRNAGQFTNSPAHSIMVGGDRETVRQRVATTRTTGAARKTAAPAKKAVTTPAKKTAAPVKRAAPAKKAVPAKKAAATPPVKRVAAKKATTAPATKKAVPAKKATSTRGAPNVNRALYANGTVASTSSIPRINRGGTHMMMQSNGRPLVPGSYATPGEAYYARNVGVGRISNNRLRDIFEDPSNMTLAERRMIASAGGAKNLDGEDMIEVQTSRGPRLMERYKVIGQLRSKMAPGSGNREETRQSAEAREKQSAKRRASGKPSAAGFAAMEKQITEDWSTDGGKSVVCVFCGKKMSPKEMSVETPKPKALGGNYRDRGGRWPSHASCNTKAGEQAQKDPIAYQEDMMAKFARLPLATRKRLPHVYDYFPQLGTYPGSQAERAKYMARGPK